MMIHSFILVNYLVAHHNVVAMIYDACIDLDEAAIHFILPNH
jgi:hypothetical protein